MRSNAVSGAHAGESNTVGSRHRVWILAADWRSSVDGSAPACVRYTWPAILDHCINKGSRNAGMRWSHAKAVVAGDDVAAVLVLKAATVEEASAPIL